VTLAPELPGRAEVARMLAVAGVIPALGHSTRILKRGPLL
jgi:N-acetylglucosamine-6-phosphate deacetylase